MGDFGESVGPDPADLGGDPVCWASRVCPDCGSFVPQEPPTTCPRCGTAIDTPSDTPIDTPIDTA